MASREERLQQRLRGAQRRQFKDVDFNLVVPALAASPQPVPESGGPSQPAISPPAEPSQLPDQQTPVGLQVPQANVSTGIIHSANDANTSAKRRKLDTDNVSTPPMNRRPSRDIPPVDIYELRPDEEDEENSAANIARELLDQIPVPEATPKSATFPTAALRSPVDTLRHPPRTLDEVTESPSNAPGSGHRRRVPVSNSIRLGSQLQDVINNSLVETEGPPSSPGLLVSQGKRRRGEAAPSSPSLDLSQLPRSSSGQMEDTVHDHNGLSPETSLNGLQIPDETVDHESEEEEPSISKDTNNQEAESIDDEEAAVVLRKNQGRRKSRSLSAESADVTGAGIQDSPVLRRRKRSRADPSPVQQRHPKKTNSKPKAQSSKKTANKPKLRSGSPIPITVLRFVGEVFYDDDEEDADILNAPIPRAKRGGVNCIDVLLQICQEGVNSGIQTLKDAEETCKDRALRREYSTKRNAVAAFWDELQTQLNKHTMHLDNTYALERRLRDEQKQKLKLREEILRIRAEREQIALRMDDVRMKHEKDMTNTQDRDALNNAVHDIELAIDLGKTDQPQESDDRDDMVGTELLLKRVADQVSNKGDSGGILKQIKELNAFLERAALSLESKKS